MWVECGGYGTSGILGVTLSNWGEVSGFSHGRGDAIFLRIMVEMKRSYLSDCVVCICA